MGLFGDLVKLGFGGPPDLLPWQDINAQEQQRTAIAGNLSALPQATDLAGRVNTFNQAEIQRMLELALPGYSKMRDRGSDIVNDFMKGVIPGDVSNAVMRNAAARSLYGGFGGSGMSRNLTARDLGLTSLDLMTRGLDSAQRWISLARTLAPTMDVTSMFLTPQQQIAFSTSERDKKLSYQNMKQQFEYAVDPMRAVENDVAQIGDMVGTALMAYMGGGLTGIGGGMAGGAGGGMGGLMGGAGGGGGFMGGLGGMFNMFGGGGFGAAMQMFNGFLGTPGYNPAQFGGQGPPTQGTGIWNWLGR